MQNAPEHSGATQAAAPNNNIALPTLTALQATAHVVSLPLKTRFRGITTREAMLFKTPTGWTEFAPFTEYAPQEAATWLYAAISAGWHTTPPLKRQSVEINATVPAVPAAKVPAILASFPGCKTAKIKIAEKNQNLKDDLARIKAVRAYLGEDAKIRLDANGGFGVYEALTAAKQFAAYNIDYLEQPCETVAELARLRKELKASGLTIKIAADESVRKAKDPLAVARAQAADLLVIKASPLGGVTKALQIIEKANLPVVVSSALDTSIGLLTGLRLACTLPDTRLYGACGLGTAALLAADTVADPLLPKNGELAVRNLACDTQLLKQYAATSERENWWRKRLEDCYYYLQRALTKN